MIYKKTMPNGLRIVGEKRTDVHSFSLSVWVKTGSCNEDDANNGISHFIEHMLFKGTAKRSAKDIAVEVDRVGGQINAFTAKECTCFYIKVIDENIELAVDMLSDILLNSRFDADEMNKERGVILEEIAMVEDAPDELVHELLAKTMYASHPLGRTILGSAENIRRLTPQDMKAYIKNNYISGRIVLAVAGNFDETRFEDLVDRYFCQTMTVGAPTCSPCAVPVVFNAKRSDTIKDNEQLNVCWGFPGVSFGDDGIYAISILNNILGGGMSSRLFQTIREQNGLAYSVYTYPSLYTSVGSFNIYAGMTLSNCEAVFKLVRKEIDRLRAEKITQSELADARQQMKGGYVLSNENLGSIVNSMAKGELLLNRVQSPEEVIAKMNAVTLDDVNNMIDYVFDYEKMSMAVVGKNIDNISF